MASDIRETPFVKQLAANDRPTREKALDSLRTYLTSGRDFTRTDLLKIWKGLFFCIYHTPPPSPYAPQTHLTHSLTSLLLSLPTPLFIPFLTAFWSTINTYYPSLPHLRLDKYLYLIRQYIASSFNYLSRQGWYEGLVGAWVEMMQGKGEEGVGPLSVRDGRVSDGVRYHVLDVWVDGLVGAEGWEEVVRKGGVMRPVEELRVGGRTKTVRERAREVLEDERLKDEEGEKAEEEAGNEDGEWGGLED
ncbi:hypothetical protein JMJ35_007769 [Cladonia borealis]|uniref:Nucleolar protein NOP52 variant n=1 Tax=Cladonia borealis TaxID=184061 RepID=A0AA39QWI3_9LECA|nr:hypothetical protein JMJ35_007769 [Cladonia borealis]